MSPILAELSQEMFDWFNHIQTLPCFLRLVKSLGLFSLLGSLSFTTLTQVLINLLRCWRPFKNLKSSKPNPSCCNSSHLKLKCINFQCMTYCLVVDRFKKKKWSEDLCFCFSLMLHYLWCTGPGVQNKEKHFL